MNSKAWLNLLTDLGCGWLMRGWVEEDWVFMGKAVIATKSMYFNTTKRKIKVLFVKY